MNEDRFIRAGFPLAEYIIGVKKTYSEFFREDVYYVTYMFENNRGYRLVVNTNLFVISGMETVFNDDCHIALVGYADARRYDMALYTDYEDSNVILHRVLRKDNVSKIETESEYFFDPCV